MSASDLSSVSDGDLVAGLKALVVQERGLSAAILEHLGEVDARQLYLPAACSSMHRYCVVVLGMAEEVAFKRIRAARAARRFPVVFEAVVRGRLNVSAVVLIAPHLTVENAEELVAEVCGKSKAQIEVCWREGRRGRTWRRDSSANRSRVGWWIQFHLCRRRRRQRRRRR